MTRVVGFVGVGQMGAPMVRRLLAAGNRVVFSARRPEVVEATVADGATVRPDPAVVAAEADLVILCLFSDTQVREVVFSQGVASALRPGSVLVNHTTGSPSLARELADALPAAARLLDAPVSGSAEDIAAGRLTVLVGGEAETLERARPVLAAYGDPIIPVGPVGAAQLVKLLNNLLFTVHLGLAGRLGALGEALGIERTALVAALGRSSGNSYALERLAGAPFDLLAERAGPFLRKDVATVRTVAEELGIDLGELGRLASWVDELPG